MIAQSEPRSWSIASGFVLPGTSATPIARGPSRISRGPSSPSRAVYAANIPSKQALPVCTCFEWVASRRNCHRPAAWVPAVPIAERVFAASSFKRCAVAAATPMTPPVAVEWKR